MTENKNSSAEELEIEGKINLIFSKAKELCELVGTMYCEMSITINSDKFYITQRYDKDSSFADKSDNSDDNRCDSGDNGKNRNSK